MKQDPKEQCSAIRSLCFVVEKNPEHQEEAIPALVERFLCDDDQEVKRVAKEALLRLMGREEFVRLLDAMAWGGDEKIKALVVPILILEKK